jgi:prephenate dehydrogenase
MIERISIFGTGLLGGSVGLALRAAGYKGSIVGVNRGAEQARIALEMGAIDSIAADPLEAARQSQVVVLAVPVYATLDWMEKLAGVLGPCHLVTDVGSTKRMISEAAARLYNAPDRAGFLPGHPMAGKERSGAALASADLFQGMVWLFTPWPVAPAASAAGAEAPSSICDISGPAEAVPLLQNRVPSHNLSRAEDAAVDERALTPEGASEASKELMVEWRKWVAAMGSRILDLDPVRHDEMVAWVSHLPQFASTALSALLEEEIGEAPELKDIGGRALREMTRLGASPFSMWRDIAYTNTEAVEKTLLALEQRLAHLRENLRTPELRAEFEQANRFRRE